MKEHLAPYFRMKNTPANPPNHSTTHPPTNTYPYLNIKKIVQHFTITFFEVIKQEFIEKEAVRFAKNAQLDRWAWYSASLNCQLPRFLCSYFLFYFDYEQICAYITPRGPTPLPLHNHHTTVSV